MPVRPTIIEMKVARMNQIQRKQAAAYGRIAVLRDPRPSFRQRALTVSLGPAHAPASRVAPAGP
jgi:hypothetical protein